MNMTFDGFGRFHLGFKDQKDGEAYDFMFSVEDTEALALFLQSIAHDVQARNTAKAIMEDEDALSKMQK